MGKAIKGGDWRGEGGEIELWGLGWDFLRRL